MSPRPNLTAFLFSLVACAQPMYGKPPSTRPSTKPAELKFVLLTKTYEVTITRSAEEGIVADDNVTYHALSKKSGQTITLKGSTWHTHGPDGTPSRFLGYEFHDGNVTYQVTETGHLMVIRNRQEILIDEDGKWQ